MLTYDTVSVNAPPRVVDNNTRIVWATDGHITDNTLIGTDSALRMAVRDASQWGADFFVHTGDVGGNVAGAVGRGVSNMKAGTRPFYFCFGNHDLNEVDEGSPQIAEVAQATGFAPTYSASTYMAGSTEVLIVSLYCNFYNDNRSANHVQGDQVGYNENEPSGGYSRQLGSAQLAWLTSLLQSSSAAWVLLLMHYPPNAQLTDHALLGDIVAADARPFLGMCGHVHNNAFTYTLLDSEGGTACSVLKIPAQLESGAWARLTVSPLGVVVGDVEIYNYVPQSGWTIGSGYTVV